MKTAAQVAALLLTALGFALSAELLRRVIGTDSPWLALLLMFYFLGLAKVAEPLCTLRLPACLRPLRAWELNGPAYRRLGVAAFGRLLRKSWLRYLNLAVYLARGRDRDTVRRYAEAAEASHFWAAVLFAPYVAYCAGTARWGFAGLFSLVQLLFNVYPILHLRVVRGRLDRAALRESAIGGKATRC